MHSVNVSHAAPFVWEGVEHGLEAAAGGILSGVIAAPDVQRTPGACCKMIHKQRTDYNDASAIVWQRAMRCVLGSVQPMLGLSCFQITQGCRPSTTLHSMCGPARACFELVCQRGQCLELVWVVMCVARHHCASCCRLGHPWHWIGRCSAVRSRNSPITPRPSVSGCGVVSYSCSGRGTGLGHLISQKADGFNPSRLAAGVCSSSTGCHVRWHHS